MTLFKRVWQNLLPFKEFFFQGLKFSIVGIINTIVSWVAFFSLYYLFKIDFKIANIISYILGVINSFILNKFWTFKSKKYKLSEIFLFFLVFFVSFGIQYYFTIFLKERLKINPSLAYICGNILYTIIGFLGNKFLTFRKI